MGFKRKVNFMNEKIYQVKLIYEDGTSDYSDYVFESETQAYLAAKNAVLSGVCKGFYIKDIYLIKRGD